MCLILVGVGARPGSRVVLLANRDEFHARPSAPAAPWAEDARVLGGRDLVAGGSWLAVRGDGRFAAVTNLRNGSPVSAPRSRGALVRDYVCGEDSAEAYLHGLLPQLTQFAPFNLIVGDAGAVFALDGGTRGIRRLAAGLHAVGNGPLDAEWPKARRLRAQVRTALQGDVPAVRWLDLLRDTALAADDELPDTGIGIERERLLSPIFIAGDAYGTRASTVLDIRDDGVVDLMESRFGPHAARIGTGRWTHPPGTGWERHA